MRKDVLREIGAFGMLACAAFVFFSLYSFDQRDLLLDGETRNFCGILGAHVAFFLMSWIGSWGAHLLTAAAAILGLCAVFRRQIEDLGWKLTAMAILLLVFSTLEVALTDGADRIRTLPGGIYGQFFYIQLLSKLNWLGAYLILALALLVAVLISTELRLSPALNRAGEAAFDGRRWRSARAHLGSGLRRLHPLRGSAHKRKPSHGSWHVWGTRWIGRLAGGTAKPAARERSAHGRPTAENRARRAARGEGRTESRPAAGTTGKSTRPRARPAAGEEPRLEEETEVDAAELIVQPNAAPGRQGKKRPKQRIDEDDDELEEDEDDEDEYEDEEEDDDDTDYEDEDDEDEDDYDEDYDDDDDDYDYDEEDDDEEEEEEEDDDDDGENYEDDDDDDDDERDQAGAVAARKVDDQAPFEMKINVAEPVARTRKVTAAGPRRKSRYTLPGLDALAAPVHATDSTDRAVIAETAAKIEEALSHFKIEARVVEVQKGPVITQYELSLAAGIKVHKIVSLADDLSMALKAESIRIVAPIPGKDTVGIEVPNRTRVKVGLRELIESREFNTQKLQLPLTLGKDIAGKPIVGDLADMPHLLIAGSTGSGKSVAINTIIIDLLLTKTPEEVKIIMIDPKMVELSLYEDIPHLLTPVVTDMKKAPAVLNWLVDKMEERYELLARAGVRHLTSYNELGRTELHERLRSRMSEEDIKEVPDFLPYIVVIIDELADLMMTASKEVEGSITRLSQKSRAVGIHVILATQRPSVDVITGLIKANMPCRISFHVTSKVDSRTILDRNGADKLLGKGDMLYLAPGTSNLVRAQGTFISDREINDIVRFVRGEAAPQFDNDLSKFGLEGAGNGSDEDDLYDDSVRIVLGSQRGSVTLLQRQLQIGYTRASRLMELMHANGLVGPFKGSKAREVYYTLEEWESARNANAEK